MGNTSEVKPLLQYSDVFLMCSEKESFGLSALEAMAAKTPIVSTDVGGLPEINKQGVTGFLSQVGDIKDMASNTISILKDENTLNIFKNNAFEYSKKFDIKNILPLYSQVYQKAIRI